jgi:hypothetical protein
MLWRKRPGPRSSPYESMIRLAGRLARRERLRELHAPDTILDAEERLVKESLHHLSPGQALFVLRHRDALMNQFDGDGDGTAATSRPRDPAQVS